MRARGGCLCCSRAPPLYVVACCCSRGHCIRQGPPIAGPEVSSISNGVGVACVVPGALTRSVGVACGLSRGTDLRFIRNPRMDPCCCYCFCARMELGWNSLGPNRGCTWCGHGWHCALCQRNMRTDSLRSPHNRVVVRRCLTKGCLLSFQGPVGA